MIAEPRHRNLGREWLLMEAIKDKRSTQMSLEERVALIEDEMEIKSLIDRYCERADAHDWQGWANTFAEDALDEFEGAFGVTRGRQAIMASARDFMNETWDDFMHYIVNVDVKIAGDSAEGTSNIVFIGLMDSNKPTEYYMSGGRYRWRFVRTSEGWCIAHKNLRFLWNNGGPGSECFVDRSEAN